MAGYYRQCIPGFATLAVPLTEITKPTKGFQWGESQQEAFEKIKAALSEAPIVAHPDVTKPYNLYTDASDKCVGAILVQKDENGIERVIHYLSHKLSDSHLHWPIIEKEAFAIIYALKKLYPHLWQFEILIILIISL